MKKILSGLCSGQPVALEPGDRVPGFLRRRPGFDASRGRAPLILIGKDTGMGPLAGIIGANARRRPVHLVFGLQDPDSDLLYRDDLAAWQAEGRLCCLTTAISRAAQPQYVKDQFRAEGAKRAEAIRQGAKVIVCSGRDMAQGVACVLADILVFAGMTPTMLKAEGQRVEDVH